MTESPDVGSPLEPRTRLFTPEEANLLVPVLERIMRRMDTKLAQLKEIRDLLDDQKAYWGPRIMEAPAAEREARGRHLRELRTLKASLESDLRRIRRMGCEMKDPYLGLIDFRALMDGRLVFLCWQRGESRVGHWHTLEGGYASRKRLSEGPRAER